MDSDVYTFVTESMVKMIALTIFENYIIAH